MPRPVGPTVPRWQLGEELRRRRDDAGVAQADMAKRLACSVSKIQKIEYGIVSISQAELELMLAMYKVPEGLHEGLLELGRLGKQRGWWSKFGLLPKPFYTFLGMETAATSISVFEPLVVAGLCQTEEYMRAYTTAVAPKMTASQVDQQVRIRKERQKLVLDNDDRPDLRIVLDEAVIRRVVGGPAVMKAQLEHLLELGGSGLMALHVVPFGGGSYPGSMGPLYIFEFDENLHSPVAYTEGQAGNHYLEDEKDLVRCSLAFKDIVGAALSKSESAKLIRRVIRELPTGSE